MTKTKKASPKKTGSVKLFVPETAVSSAAKRGGSRRTKESSQYPGRFDDMKHMFLPKNEFLQLKAMLRDTVNWRGDM